MLLFLLSLFFLPSKVLAAQDDFNISQNIQFEYHSNLSCLVEEKISITNNFSQIYLKEYKIKLNQKGLSNIKAYDNIGNILQNLEQTNDSTTIFLKFNQPQVGKNQQTNFTLSYNVEKCSVKKGKTYEITIPKFVKTNSNHQININLLVPVSFGQISSSSIKQYTYHTLSQFHQFAFSLPNNSAPVIFIFGDHQLFDFSLDYYLENTESQLIRTQIALPPDTDYQTVRYSQINPQPQNVVQDQDGNWLGTYEIKANDKLTINASGQVKIIPPIHKPVEINQSSYQNDQPYWPVSAEEIKSVAASLTSPKSIYQFVVDYLSYDYNRFNSAKRQGAKFALLNPQNALCTEFTDLFVTIARSKNIPAREIQGYAYSQDDKIKPINANSDVLHAWPQYFDKSTSTWISVDPTWEKTTNGINYFSDLDLNHFTFVIHGLQSDYPPPPGAYKNSQNIKTVNVEFSQNEIKTEIVNPIIYRSFSKLVLKNPNLQAIHNVKITSNNLETTIPILPPLGQVDLKSDTPFYQLKTTFTVQSDETPQADLLVNGRYQKIIPIILIGFSIIILSILGIIIISPKHEKTS